MRVLGGALILVLALAYGTWATRRLGQRGSERDTFDQALVSAAGRLIQRPDRIPDIPVTTTTELELAAVARDQQDLLFGLILLTAGSTEWEVRSERLRTVPTPVS